MNTLWEKIVFWTKAIIFGILALCAISLLLANLGVEVQDINLVVRMYHNVSLEKVLFIDSVVSIFTWWLFWTVLRAVRRIKAAAAARSDATAASAPPSSPPATPSSPTPNSSNSTPFTPPK